VWNETDRAGQGLVHRALAPVMLLGLMRLVPRVMVGPRAAWMEDRALVALALAAGSLMGWLDGTIVVLAVAYLGTGLNVVRAAPQLTPL